MLFIMPGATSTSLKDASFASLLAGFASPSRAAEWPADSLEDDVATISYERALRTHARTRPSEPLPDEPPAVTQKACADTHAADPRPAASSRRKPPVSVRISEWEPSEAPATAESAAPARDKQIRKPSLLASHKSASVTVRLTAEDNAQLHERAAAAGLTASAYLRSCLFEAESLRMQVKEALEQFRAASDPAVPKDAHPAQTQSAAQSRRLGRLSRWFGFVHAKSA